jgi:hypothetical protein
MRRRLLVVGSFYNGVMKRFLTTVVLSSCFSLLAWPQTTTLPPSQLALAQIRPFLGLTDNQVNTILQNNAAYDRFSFQQQNAIRNAQSQIAVETAKDPLDPMAIGTLYAGIESACRELRDKAATSRKENLSILTDVQRAKLEMLNDAIKLAPTISEAQSANLLGTPNSTPFAFPVFSPGILTGVVGFATVSGCASPALFPGNIIPVTRLGAVAPTGVSQSSVALLSTMPDHSISNADIDSTSKSSVPRH